MDSSNEFDAVIPDENKAIVQDSVERSEHSLGKEKNKISNEELRSQHTLEDNFKKGEQVKSVEGCSIPDLDDANLVVYNGPDLRSPYEYLSADVKKPLSDVEKIVADTLFAMIGSKMQIPAYYIGKDKDDEKFFPYHKNQRYKGIPQAIRKVFVQYLYHVKHPKAEAIEKAKITRMSMKWRTKHNYTDCGVFTMLHMESYLGAEREWNCGLAKESKQQDEQLNSLRSKFAAKIILSEFNLLKKKFMKLVQQFEQKPWEERKKTIDHAIANRDHRENIEEAPIANNDECKNIEEANIPSRNSCSV
ncbi:hypothetical protein Tco_0000617 [Tanacetum coccineum]